jgi:hypothetical protein
MTHDLSSTFDPDEVPVEWYAERMRIHRDRLLKESDWTQLPDAPIDREAWATYRQALRDFPATWTEGPEADFPDTP